ncbi:MAG: class I SAM-dependent methyltransferase [Gemmatimonadales bacterium]
MSVTSVQEGRQLVMAATERANEHKADFGNVYNQADPRDYFHTLGALDYQIPQNAKPWLLRIIQALRQARQQERVTLLDVGCSYGINAALLRHDLDLDDLYHHYSAAIDADISSNAMMEQDREFFHRRTVDMRLRTIGLDTASHAVKYGRWVGLLDAALIADLEEEQLRPGESTLIDGVDLVISTGCIGYVSERTFERLLAARGSDPTPVIASFVLRMFPYDNIAAVLARHGLRTFKLENRTFAQRRFADDDEEESVLVELRNRGIHVEGRERLGFLHAELYLSTPPSSRIIPLLGHTWSVVAEP